jgi:hypothetical protein
VIGVGCLRPQGEFFVRFELGIWLDGSCGDTAIVSDLVQICCQRRLCALKCCRVADVEVAVLPYQLVLLSSDRVPAIYL